MLGVYDNQGTLEGRGVTKLYENLCFQGCESISRVSIEVQAVLRLGKQVSSQVRFIYLIISGPAKSAYQQIASARLTKLGLTSGREAPAGKPKFSIRTNGFLRLLRDYSLKLRPTQRAAIRQPVRDRESQVCLAGVKRPLANLTYSRKRGPETSLRLL